MSISNYFSFYGVLSTLIILFSIVALSSTFLLYSNPNYETQLQIPEGLRSAVSSTLSSLNPNKFSVSDITSDELSLNSRLLNSQNVSIVKVEGEECQFRQESSQLHLNIESCNIDTNSQEVEIEVETEEGRQVSLQINPRKFIENNEDSSRSDEDTSSDEDSPDDPSFDDNSPSSSTGGSSSSGGGPPSSGSPGSSNDRGNSPQENNPQEKTPPKVIPPPEKPTGPPLEHNSSSTIIYPGVMEIELSHEVPYYVHPDGSVSVEYTEGLQLISTNLSSTYGTNDTNGMMLNPGAGAPFWRLSFQHGFDERMSGTKNYNRSSNIHPNITKSAINLNIGDSLLMTKSNYGENVTDSKYQQQRKADERNPIMFYRRLHIREELPKYHEYAPPIRGNMSYFNFYQETVHSNIDKLFSDDLDVLFRDEKTTKTIIEKLRKGAQRGEIASGYAREPLAAVNGLTIYGESFANIVYDGIIQLMINETFVNESYKKEIADYITQLGIDRAGLVLDNGAYQSNGAHNIGELALVLITGLLTENQYLVNMALDPLNKPSAPPNVTIEYYPFTEQRVYGYITSQPRTDGLHPDALDSGSQTSPWGVWPGSGGEKSCCNRLNRVRLDEGSELVGKVYYQIYPDRNDGRGNTAWYFKPYGSLNIGVNTKFRIILHYINKSNFDINHLRPMIKVVDREVVKNHQLLNSNIPSDAYTINFGFELQKSNVLHKKYYNKYLKAMPDNFISTLSFSPKFPFPPRVHEVSNGFYVEPFKLELNGNTPIIQRNVRWRKEGNSNWNYENNYIANTTILHNLENGGILEAQIQLVNKHGESDWSTNAPYNTHLRPPFNESRATTEITQAIQGDYSISLSDFSRNMSIFDSDAARGNNNAAVPIHGNSTAPDGTVIESRAISIDDNGATTTSWRDVATVSEGNWSGILNTPRSTSWYRVEARIKGDGSSLVSSSNTFGVGHVWAIWEQSNWARLFFTGDIDSLYDKILYENDVQFVRNNLFNMTRVNDINKEKGLLTPSIVSMANAFSSVRNGEKLMLVLHTKSGTNPMDGLTTEEEDTVYGTQGRRNWDTEKKIHSIATIDGSQIGAVFVPGWVDSLWGAGQRIPKIHLNLFVGKSPDNQTVTAEDMGLPRLYSLSQGGIYNWTYSRFGYFGPHGKWGNDFPNASEISSFEDLPMYPSIEYDLLMDNAYRIYNSSNIAEVLDYPGVSHGALEGKSNEGGHFSKSSRDGQQRLGRIGMFLMLNSLDLISIPVPELNNRWDEPNGEWVDFWIENYDLTTERLYRAQQGTLGEIPLEIPKIAPHRIEVMGFSINREPAKRAEIVTIDPNDKSRGHPAPIGRDVVRVWPNNDKFDWNDYVVYGLSPPGFQIKEDTRDSDDMVILNWLGVDMGQPDELLPLLVVQHQGNSFLPTTLEAPDLIQLRTSHYRTDDPTLIQDFNSAYISFKGRIDSENKQFLIGIGGVNILIRPDGSLEINDREGNFAQTKPNFIQKGVYYDLNFLIDKNVGQEKIQILDKDGNVIESSYSAPRNINGLINIGHIGNIGGIKPLEATIKSLDIYLGQNSSVGEPSYGIRATNMFPYYEIIGEPHLYLRDGDLPKRKTISSFE